MPSTLPGLFGEAAGPSLGESDRGQFLSASLSLLVYSEAEDHLSLDKVMS